MSSKVLSRLALNVPALRRVYRDYLTVRNERDEARTLVEHQRTEIAELRRQRDADGVDIQHLREEIAAARTQSDSAPNPARTAMLVELEAARASVSDSQATIATLQAERKILEAEISRSTSALVTTLKEAMRAEIMQPFERIASPKALFEDVRQRLVNIEYKANRIQKQMVPLTKLFYERLASEDGQLDTPPYLLGEEQRFGSISFAQHGDDFIAAAIFEKIGIEDGTYIDVGAHHPFKISNTALLHQNGWTGINIEANPDLIGAFERWRPSDVNLNIGVSDEQTSLTFYRFDDSSGLNTFDVERMRELEGKGMVVQDTINIVTSTLPDLLEEHAGGKFPDFLSLDVEGFDLRILKSIDFERSKPKLICVEANTDQEAQDLVAFLSGKGYYIIFQSVTNLFFLDQAFRNRFLMAL